MATKTKTEPTVDELPGVTVTTLPINKLSPDPNNERDLIGEIENGSESFTQLVQSIKESGIIEPLTIYLVPAEQSPSKAQEYVVSSGHRRLAAAQKAGLDRVPVVIKPLPDNLLDVAISRLVANLQRQDLTDLEKAEGLRSVLDANPKLTQAKLAQRIGVSQPAIANSLRLLTLPDEIKETVHAGLLSAGHAIALLRVKEAESDWTGQLTRSAEQVVADLAETASAKGWSVRTLDAAIDDYNNRVTTIQQSLERQKKEAEDRAAEKEKTKSDPDEKARRQAEAQKRKEKEQIAQARVMAAQDAIVSAMAWDHNKEGPSRDHLRLVANILAEKLYGYADTPPPKFPPLTQLRKEIDISNHLQLLNIITKLAVAKVVDTVSYTGLSLLTHQHSVELAAKQWNLLDAIRKKQLAAGLLDDEKPAPAAKEEEKPDPMKFEHGVG